MDSDEKIIVLDDLSTGFEWLVPPNVPFIKGNVGDKTLLSHIFKQYDVNAIIHFAASIVLPDSIIDPLGYYRNNTINSHALIACAIEHGIRHFIFSTSAVYGSAVPTPVPEDAATEPESPYGWSKLMTERILRDVGNVTDLRYVILRYSSMPAAPTPVFELGNQALKRLISLKSPSKLLSANGPRWKFSATTIQPPMAPASGITLT